MNADRRWRRRRVAAGFAAAMAVGTLVSRRMGYGFGGNTFVRCRKGHLFTTIWIPGASIKALRLGWWRFQRCPVGAHWSIVTPVRQIDLSDRELEFAYQHRDVRVP
jgi:hypothetical protein